MSKAILLFASFFLLVGCGSAPLRTISQATDNPQAVEKGLKFSSLSNGTQGPESGKGYFPRLKALGAPPKRIAFVTFGVISESYSGKHVAAVLSDAGANKIVNTMYTKTIDDIKTAFKNNGMEVLEPSQYLDNEEKKTAFSEFTIDLLAGNKMAQFAFGMAKAGRSIAIASTALEPGTAVPNGFRLFPGISNSPENPNIINGLGNDLAAKLGVDAVLVVANDCSTDGKHAYLLRTVMSLYGPNPIHLKEADLGGMAGGLKGQLYAGISTDDALLQKVSLLPPDQRGLDGLDNPKNYDGYEKIVGTMATKVASYVARMTTEK